MNLVKNKDKIEVLKRLNNLKKMIERSRDVHEAVFWINIRNCLLKMVKQYVGVSLGEYYPMHKFSNPSANRSKKRTSFEKYLENTLGIKYGMGYRAHIIAYSSEQIEQVKKEIQRLFSEMDNLCDSLIQMISNTSLPVKKNVIMERVIFEFNETSDQLEAVLCILMLYYRKLSLTKFSVVDGGKKVPHILLTKETIAILNKDNCEIRLSDDGIVLELYSKTEKQTVGYNINISELETENPLVADMHFYNELQPFENMSSMY